MDSVNSFLPKDGKEVVERLKEGKQQSTKRSGVTDQYIEETLRELTRMRLLGQPTAEMVQSWTRGLTDKTEAELAMGVKKARDFTGFLSLPEFRKLCQITPEDAGLPRTDQAWQEAAQNAHDTRHHKWSHPCVYQALANTGIFEVRNTDNPRETYKQFAHYYEIACRQYMAGETLETPPPAIEHQRPAKASTEGKGYQEFKKLRGEIGL